MVFKKGWVTQNIQNEMFTHTLLLILDISEKKSHRLQTYTQDCGYFES